MFNYLDHLTHHLQESGFALIAMMGVLAIIVIMATVMVPNMVTSFNLQAEKTEQDILEAIGTGSAAYLRSTRTWALTLAAHGPDYAPLDSLQLLQNNRRFPRYYALHPDMSGFNNSAGLTETELTAARFLLISNRQADAAPTVINEAEFTAWWETDERAVPGLHLYRGNLADLFVRVTLLTNGSGGSYQVDAATTNSSGGTLPAYTRYHLPGTIVRLDEANTYGTPEVEIILTGNMTMQYDSSCPAGKQWHVPGVACGGEPAQFWITTSNDVTGKSGVGAWNEDMMIAVGDPNLAFESGPTGSTAGTFRGPLVDLHVFGASVVESLHFVSRDITIGGGANTVALKAGDILASDTNTVTMVSMNSLSVQNRDVYVFRPTKPGDYSSGTFFMLFDGSDLFLGLLGSQISGFTLIETETEVGDITIPAGSFLMRIGGNAGIRLFVPTAAGNTTAGTVSTLYNDGDYYDAFELLEAPRKLGDVTLKKGQILATTVSDGVLVGDNNVSVNNEDVFALELAGSGFSQTGTATMIFDGSDAGLTPGASSNAIVGMTLSGTCRHWLLPIINPGFETGNLTGWTATNDLFGNGGVNRWNAVNSSTYMPGPASGTFFASAEALGATGGTVHRTGLSQRIDLSACAADIDAGNLLVTVTGRGHGQTDVLKRDYATLQMAFYDSVVGGSQLGGAIKSNRATAYAWTDLSIPYSVVPMGTRSVELLALGSKNAEASHLDAGVDSLGGLLIAMSNRLNQVSNESFEELSAFTGWTYAGTVGTLLDGSSSLVLEQAADFGIVPPDGTYQARIRTFGTAPNTLTSGLDNGQLEAFLGLTNSEFNAKTGISIVEFVGLKQTVVASTGSQLTFRWNFGTIDTPGSGDNDVLFFSVTDGTGTEVQFTTLASVNGSTFFPEGPGGHGTGYQTTTFNFPSAGTYTIHIGVAEDQDLSTTSYVYLDDFQIATP